MKAGERRKAVADYVRERDAEFPNEAPGGMSWEKWLQTHRIELNVMTTREFIDWLDLQMTEHGGEKLIPPDEVIEKELKEQLDKMVRESVRERILREAGYERQVAEALEAIELPSGSELIDGIQQMFDDDQSAHWADLHRPAREEFYMTSNITDEMKRALAEFKGEVERVPRGKRAADFPNNWRRAAACQRHPSGPGPTRSLVEDASAYTSSSARSSASCAR